MFEVGFVNRNSEVLVDISLQLLEKPLNKNLNHCARWNRK